MHERASAALEAAGPGGLVLSLDGLGHLALVRARGTMPEPGGGKATPRVLDASLVASGADLRQLEALRTQIAATLARGGHVVAARDMILPERFEHANWPLDWTDANHVGGMDRLVEGFAARPADPEAGLASWLWQLE
jgi:hypothetical protein